MCSFPILAASAAAAAAAAAAPTPPTPAVLSIAELDALYAAGQLHGKQRDAARKRKERREKTAATIAALHLPDNEVASAFTQLRKSGVKVNSAADTHQLKRHRERQAEYRGRKSAAASPAHPASPVHPAAASPPRPAAAPLTPPPRHTAVVRTELNTQDLEDILGYSVADKNDKHEEERKEPEVDEIAPVHPPSLTPLPSSTISPTYDYLPAASQMVPAASSSIPLPAVSPPIIRSPSPKRARSSAASGVRASGLRRKPLAQLLVPQRQAAATAVAAWRNSQEHKATEDDEKEECAASISALLLHHPPPLGTIPNEPLSVELTAIILSKLDEWRKGESAASAAAYAAAGTAAASRQERVAAANMAGRRYASARRIDLKLLMGPKCAATDCSSTILLDRSNVRWFHCDHLDPSTKLNPDDILCNCQTITQLQKFLLKNTHNGRLFLQLLCINCHAIKPQ